MSALTKINKPEDLVQLLELHAAEMRAEVRANPIEALLLLDEGRKKSVLTPVGQVRVLEEILGEIPTIKEARAFLNQTLSPDTVAEFMVLRGDLPSVMSIIVDIDTVVRALVSACTDQETNREEKISYSSLVLRSWASQLSERSDWQLLLRKEIGEYTLRDLLITAVYVEAGRVRNITPSDWEEVGLNPHRSHRRLKFLIRHGKLPQLDTHSWQEIKEKLNDQKERFAKESPLAVATKEAANQIDL